MYQYMPSQTMSAATTLPLEGQQAALRVTDLHERLCLGENRLDDTVWEQLVKAKLPAKSAKALARKTDSPERLAYLLATERRATMLVEGLANVAVTSAQLETLLAGRGAKVASRAVAARWSAHQDERLAAHVAAVATHAGGAYLIEQMAINADSFDAETVAELLATMTSWAARGGATRSRALKGLLAFRPELADVFVELGATESALMTVVAGSSQLAGHIDLQEKIAAAVQADPATFLWATRSFVYNPFVSVEVLNSMDPKKLGYESVDAIKWRVKSTRGYVTEHLRDVSEPEHLEWLIKRSIPGNYRGEAKPGRPFDLLELWDNPNLDEAQRSRVHGGLKSYETWSTLDLFGIDSHTVIGEEEDPSSTQRPWEPEQATARDLSDVGQWPVKRATQQHHADDAAAWFATKIGTADQWQLLFVLADDVPDCTLEELAEMVTLVL